MNNLQRDQFIFNYLEGNLNKSEQALFEELVETDTDFKQEVSKWDKSYVLQSMPKEVFALKTSLQFHKVWIKYYVAASVLAIAVLSFCLFESKEIRTEQVQNEPEKVSNTLHTPQENQGSEALMSNVFEGNRRIEKGDKPLKNFTITNTTTTTVFTQDLCSESIILPLKKSTFVDTNSVTKSVLQDTLKSIALVKKDTLKPIEKKEVVKPKKTVKDKTNNLKRQFTNQSVVPVK